MYVLVKYTLLPRPEYSRKKAKRLRKFNPRNDKIIIGAGAFALDESSIIFAKNRHAYRQSLRSDHSFIYCKQKSELIYNENGRKNSFGDEVVKAWHVVVPAPSSAWKKYCAAVVAYSRSLYLSSSGKIEFCNQSSN